MLIVNYLHFNYKKYMISKSICGNNWKNILSKIPQGFVEDYVPSIDLLSKGMF